MTEEQFKKGLLIETLGNCDKISINVDNDYYSVDVSESFKNLEEFLVEHPCCFMEVLHEGTIYKIHSSIISHVLTDSLEENLYDYFSFLRERALSKKK